MLSRATRIADDAGVSSTTVVDPRSPPVKVILKRACDHDLLAIGAPASSWLGAGTDDALLAMLFPALAERGDVDDQSHAA